MGKLRKYTKEEISALEKSAKAGFKVLKDEAIIKYSDYLKDLLKIDKDNRLTDALLKRQQLYNWLAVYLQDNYKEDELVSDNGVRAQTIGTTIYITLSTEDLIKSDSEFQQLYEDFQQKILSEDKAP